MILCVVLGDFGKETDGIKMSWIHDTPDLDFWESVDYIEPEEEEEEDAE